MTRLDAKLVDKTMERCDLKSGVLFLKQFRDDGAVKKQMLVAFFVLYRR